MDRVVILIALHISLFSYSQISVTSTKTKDKEPPKQAYDSTYNFPGYKIDLLVGQTFFVKPKHKESQKRGYYYFYTDPPKKKSGLLYESGNAYAEIKTEFGLSSHYDSLTGRSFYFKKILSKNLKPGREGYPLDESILELYDKKTKEIIYYKYSYNNEVMFPFLVEGYFNRLKRIEQKEHKELINKCHYSKNEIDEFTGVKKVYTARYNLSDIDLYLGEVRIQLRKRNKSKTIRFYLNQDLGCASSYGNSYVKIKLQNNQIVSFYHFGDTDCSDFNIIAKLTQSDILKLKKSPIKSIRFSGTDYYHDVKDIKWDTFFIDKLDCIK